MLVVAFSSPLHAQDACDSLLVVDFAVTVDGYTATFTDLTTNALNDVHYYWDYGDGVIEHLGQYQYTYSDTGTYMACLIVSGSYNGDTCAATACHQLLIDSPPVPPALLVWPQPFKDSFSMTGTELNGATNADLFDPMGHRVASMAMSANEIHAFPFPTLPAGGYLLLITGPAIERVVRVLKD